METTPVNLDQHVDDFNRVQTIFEKIATLLKTNLSQLTAQYAHGCVVDARAKSVASFAEKLLRKKKYVDPLSEMTDLCGARIVCAFESDVRAVCEAIRLKFGKAIDETNSLDQRSLLRAGEFGYRSIHY